MKKRWFGRSLILLAVICMALPVNMSFAAAEVEELHFLIPGGAGGGWDGTARGVGKALLDSGLVKQASFENMSGGGGGKFPWPIALLGLAGAGAAVGLLAGGGGGGNDCPSGQHWDGTRCVPDAVSYTHLTLPTICFKCRSRWSPYH